VYKKSKFERVALSALTIVVFVLFMMPIFWLLTTAFKFGREAFAIPPKWLSFDFTLRNFEAVLANSNTGRYLVNSIIISSGAVVFSLLVPASYFIARSRASSTCRPILPA
jgi:ABC-type glycerol-3-phosphate transport system permease component